MDRYEEKAKKIMARGEVIIAERKRRKTMILRSFAIGVGTAAVLSVGLTTFALRPPKKPTPSQSGIIVETETTSAETTVAPTSPSTTAPQTVTTEQETTVTTTAISSSTRKTTTTLRSTTKASRTTAVASRTTEVAVDTTAAVQTTAPTVTCLAPTTEDIEERIANIIMRMPEMITVAKALPAVDEDGNRIPTFPMLVDDRFYMLMLQYERGELEYTFDFNDDGKLDICDDIEFEACKACNTYKNQFGRYPVNYNEMFPDKEVVERAEHWLTNNKPVYVITYSMLYHNVEIPDAETIEEIAREYVGDRPVSDDVFKKVSNDMSNIKHNYDENYEQYYEALNRKEDEYPEYQLKMFKKIDSGELFPDADQDGSVGYMDIYYILKYYEEKATGFSRGIFSDSEVEWIEGHCDLDGDGWVNAKECTWLMNYLFYYKKYDYVTHIEMEMEYRDSQVPKDPVITIKPNS